jgi:hypothetical protein
MPYFSIASRCAAPPKIVACVSFDVLSRNFGVIEGAMSRYSGKLRAFIVVGTVLFVRVSSRWLQDLTNFTCTLEILPQIAWLEARKFHPNASTVETRAAVDPLRCSFGWRTGGLFQYRVCSSHYVSSCSESLMSTFSVSYTLWMCTRFLS